MTRRAQSGTPTYITKFTETSAYAAVAGISKDDRIDEVLGDVPQPYDSEQETRVFWSKHEDIAKPKLRTVDTDDTHAPATEVPTGASYLCHKLSELV